MCGVMRKVGVGVCRCPASGRSRASFFPVAYIVLMHGWLHVLRLFPALVLANQCAAQDNATVVELGGPGMIVVPGSWEVDGQISPDLLGGFELEFKRADSTSFRLSVDRRDAYLGNGGSDTVSVQHFITGFYRMRETAINGSWNHWTLHTVMRLLSDRSQEGCMAWQTTNDRGAKVIGLYAADDHYIFQFTMRSLSMTDEAQVQLLVDAFRGIQ